MSILFMSFLTVSSNDQRVREDVKYHSSPHLLSLLSAKRDFFKEEKNYYSQIEISKSLVLNAILWEMLNKLLLP